MEKTMTVEMTKKGVDKPELVQQRNWQAPLFDIYENKEELLLIADLPGVKTDHLQIHMDKNELTIEGLRTSAKHDHVLVDESPVCDYRRTFVVPPGIEETKIKAETKYGVLRLHLPKSEAVKPRQIQVKAG
jgi:HSP20 family molecular chaperone IbpA